MSSSWWIRVGVILLSLLWAAYTLTPTFLAESADQRLARKAEEAKNQKENQKTESQILEDEIKERIPSAVDLPLWLKKDINEAVFDCKQSCTDYEKDQSSASSKIVQKYFIKAQNDRDICAKDRLSFDQQNECAVGALKECVQACSKTDSYQLQECAQGCLFVHNNEGVAPDWVAAKLDWAKEIAQRTENPIFSKEERENLDAFQPEQIWQKAFYFSYYKGLVQENFDTCITEFSQKERDSEDCINRQINSCTNSCRKDENEELPFWVQSTIAFYPSARLSLGLDLQGGLDIDLRVQLEEAVYSDIQRDVDMIKDMVRNGLALVDNKALVISEITRVRDDVVLLILPSDGSDGKEPSTREQINSYMNKNFVLDESIQPKYSTGETFEKKGKQYMVFRLKSEASEYVESRSIEQALETLRSRIDETGVKEPSITKKSDGKINIQLPGIDDVQKAMMLIGTSAKLKFHMVDEDQMDRLRDLETAIFEAKGKMKEEDYLDDEELSSYLKENGDIADDAKMMWEYREVGEGKKVRQQFYVVKEKVDLEGSDINDANVGRNQYNEPYVSMEFKPKGGKVFEELTGANVGKRFAIVLDDEVRSAPVIRSKISGGIASIEMGTSDYQTALIESQVLSLVLRTGSLPAPVQVEKVRNVGASLGADAIDAGKKATLYGFIFVLLFMVYRYRRPGFVSIAALGVNILLVFSLLAVAGATLTLPGIAGIALTIGMAVDCNIIIYERILEERALGKPERSAVGTGFDKAFLAVLDANITTFIAVVVLYTYGTGPIKGFAVTLMIGIMTTLFTGVFLSRTIIDFFTRKATTKRFF